MRKVLHHLMATTPFCRDRRVSVYNMRMFMSLCVFVIASVNRIAVAAAWSLNDDNLFLSDPSSDQIISDASQNDLLATIPAGDALDFSNFPGSGDDFSDSLPLANDDVGNLFASGADGAPDANSLEFADCSSSTTDDLSVVSKARARRREERLGQACQNNNAMSVNRDTYHILQIPNLLDTAAAARESEEQHAACFVITRGFLPWGVCSSHSPVDSITNIWDGFPVWVLHDVILGKVLARH